MGEPRQSGRPRSAGARVRYAVRPAATRWPGPADLILTAGVAIIAVAAAIVELPPPVRVPLGLASTLFLPGYALSLVLFPKDRLDGIERAALAFTLSVGAIVLAALVVNLAPIGLTGPSLITASTTVTLGACAIAWMRSRATAGGPVRLRIDPSRALRLGDAFSRWPLVVVGAAGILLVIAVGTRMPAVSGATEFYLLGPSGRIDDSPTRVQAGHVTTITIGVTNFTGTAAPFRVTVEWHGARLAAAGPIDVAQGATWTGTIEFTAPSSGAGDPIGVHLFRGADEQPLRSLRLEIGAFVPSPGPPSVGPSPVPPSVGPSAGSP